MYHVTIRDSRKIIRDALREGLAEAVEWGDSHSWKGNRISVYEAVQDATGDILHLSKVLSVVKLEGNLKVST